IDDDSVRTFIGFENRGVVVHVFAKGTAYAALCSSRSEEHTSELQSQSNLVCRLLLEKKKKKKHHNQSKQQLNRTLPFLRPHLHDRLLLQLLSDLNAFYYASRDVPSHHDQHITDQPLG